MSDNEAAEKHPPPVMPSNWRYNPPPNPVKTTSMTQGIDPPSIDPSPSSAMVDTFAPHPPPLWENPHHSQFLGYSNVMNLQTVASSSDDLLSTTRSCPSSVLRSAVEPPPGSWDSSNLMMMKEGGLFSSMLPHSLSPFPADSAFIERAARFSCFSSENMTDMMNPFGIHHHHHQSAPINHYDQNNLSPASQNVLLAGEEGGQQNASSRKKHEGFHQEVKQSESDKTGCEEEGGPPSLHLRDTDAGVSSAEGVQLAVRKRKRGGQNTKTEESPHPSDNAADKDNGGKTSPSPASNKNSGKNGKQQTSEASDQPKEDYIHIRARRGQATNSHSLAERVRREKISERMKFLQDLVPGCNKVTGKAVMLDEIINYVQSLQRQVEFLSMKLATVNPRLSIDVESLLEKDPMFGTLAGPATWGLAPDMHLAYHRMHPSEQSLTPPGLAPTSDALRNITSQLTGMGAGYKEPSCQPPNAWDDDELHNIVQMGFNPAAQSSGNHEETNTDGTLPTELMKVEL